MTFCPVTLKMCVRDCSRKSRCKLEQLRKEKKQVEKKFYCACCNGIQVTQPKALCSFCLLG